MSGAQEPFRPPSPWAERLLRRLFLALHRLDNFRLNHKKAFHAIVVAVSIAVAVVLLGLLEDWAVKELPADLVSGNWAKAGLVTLEHLLVGFISSVTLNLLVPFLGIAQRAVAVASLGIHWATMRAGDFHSLLHYYAGQDGGETRVVRIICISGHTLFGPEAKAHGYPLQRWAELGRLKVLAPHSSVSNPTVRARWDSYDLPMRSRYGNDISGLVREMDESKGMLRTKKNQLIEHDIVIVWRAVIFERYCLVQRYLPNLDGGVSDDAPTFVFKDTGKKSFYRTFTEMFDEIERMLTARRGEHVEKA